MFKKIIVAIVILLILGVIGLMLWQQYAPKKEEGPKTTGRLMKVAKYYWPGLYWVEIADKKGWFKEAGLNVELIDTNPDFVASMVDMVEGKMDLNVFPLFDLISFRLKGADLIVVINSDISFGADVIVDKNDIENIVELKGKRIGLGKGTFSEYILDIVLERNGLVSGDVVIVDITGEKTAEEFIKGAVDVVVTWEPFATEAIEKANGRKLFDTSEISGILPEGLGFHKSFIKERPGDVQAFVNVWQKTTEFIKENPGEAFGIIAEIYNKTPGEVQKFAQRAKILDLRDNLTAFSYGAGFESLHGAARRINNFMIKKGMTKKRLDSTEFINPQFIRRLKR